LIRIAHIITGLAPDGAERMLHRLIAGMDASTFENEVIVLTDLGPMATSIQAGGVRVRALGMKRGVANPVRLPRLVSWLRKSRPHVVQTWMYHADLVGGLAAKLAGVSGIVWNIRHGELRPGTVKRHTICAARACALLSNRLPNRIVCCSQTSRKFHANFGYAAGRMQVIPNGFDVERFKPSAIHRVEVREAFRIPQGAPVIGLIGRKHTVKDHQGFICAAGLLHREFPEARFLLFGEGAIPENSELIGWMQSAGIQNVCLLLGQREDIPRILNALDIASSASTGEGFPNVVAEAMACGIPCAVTDAGDSRFIVGQTGRVVAPMAPAALADAWKGLLELSPEARGQLKLAARERIERKFGLTTVINQYEELYARVVEEASANRPPARTAYLSSEGKFERVAEERLETWRRTS